MCTCSCIGRKTALLFTFIVCLGFRMWFMDSQPIELDRIGYGIVGRQGHSPICRLTKISIQTPSISPGGELEQKPFSHSARHTPIRNAYRNDLDHRCVLSKTLRWRFNVATQPYEIASVHSFV